MARIAGNVLRYNARVFFLHGRMAKQIVLYAASKLINRMGDISAFQLHENFRPLGVDNIIFNQDQLVATFSSRNYIAVNLIYNALMWWIERKAILFSVFRRADNLSLLKGLFRGKAKQFVG